MLIFEFGAQTTQAESFATACRQKGKDAWVWPSHEALHDAFKRDEPGADFFPFALDGTVVTVERDDSDAVEDSCKRLVADFAGTFAGT